MADSTAADRQRRYRERKRAEQSRAEHAQVQVSEAGEAVVDTLTIPANSAVRWGYQLDFASIVDFVRERLEADTGDGLTLGRLRQIFKANGREMTAVREAHRFSSNWEATGFVLGRALEAAGARREGDRWRLG